MALIKIASKLPFGLMMEVEEVKQELKGINKSFIVNAEYCITEVESTFWAAWSKIHAKHKAVESGAIFAIKTAGDEKDMAKDAKDIKTGLEPLDPNSNGVTAEAK